jgi:hypothetical protein
MPSKYADRPYAVGKGKPPVHTQFGKDRPGNTKGRPAASPNADTIITKALSVRLAVKEDGKPRSISKLEAAVTQLANKAASGDLKAIDMVLKLHRDVEARTSPASETSPLSEADRAVLEQFANRVRTAKEGGNGE